MNTVKVELTVQDAEALMLEHFCTEPFHNLHLLFNSGKTLDIPGGTCSDKTLSFLKEARAMGFNAHLHSAYIGGQEIHRLVRMHIGGRIYFADIGNGWPAIKLIPADEPISYQCFGMGYRSEVQNDRISIYHEKQQGRESLQLEIDPIPRLEEDILADIKARYSSGITYPFSNSVRFSLIKGDQFLFLRGNKLEIFHEFKPIIYNISKENIINVLKDYFGTELPSNIIKSLKYDY